MHRSSRFSKSLSSPAERGGSGVVGCSPCGSQRAVAAPRSRATVFGHRVREAAASLEDLQGERRPPANVGAAPARRPNPALKRTSHGTPWAAA